MGNGISYMYLVHDLKKYIPTAVLKRQAPHASVFGSVCYAIN